MYKIQKKCKKIKTKKLLKHKKSKKYKIKI
jgi:hypothetical protein